jgi:hypothetical protein
VLVSVCVRDCGRLHDLTIASNNQELVVLVDVVYLDVRESSDYLLLRGKVGALLELEVAYRARQGEVTVDTAEVDEATCCLDTGLLGCDMLELSGYSTWFFSPSFCGLWSNESGFARPLTPRTVRESPALPYVCERA